MVGKKSIIFAVAGSGKTTRLIRDLNINDRFLFIVYTNNNLLNIQKGIIEKFGYMPNNVQCYTYFSFLFTWGIRPFLIQNYPRITGLNYDIPPRFFKKNDVRHYIKNGRIYHSRAYDFIKSSDLESKLFERISKFFDIVYIDEVQDFAGHDFDFIMRLGCATFSAMCVGDFFQHTFDTSRDGTKNKNLHNDYNVYTKKFSGFSFEIPLLICYRCPPAVCAFISSKLGIPMTADPQNSVLVTPSLVTDQDHIQHIMEDTSIAKLFYQESSKYKCNAMNWGDCKGISLSHVCVILNAKTYSLFLADKLCEMAPSTKNKFYVACTRTRGRLFFIEEKKIIGWKLPSSLSG